MQRFIDALKEAAMVAVALVALSAVIGWQWIAASYEADAYNRVTGANVSTWDALFLELRVDGQAGKKGGVD